MNLDDTCSFFYPHQLYCTQKRGICPYSTFKSLCSPAEPWGGESWPPPTTMYPSWSFFFFFFNEAETEKGPHSCKQLHLSELASLQNRVSLLPFSIGNGAILPWLLSRRNKKPHWTTVILVYDLLKYAHNGQLAEDLLAKALAKNSDLIASAEILSKKANFKKITKYLIVKTNTFTEVLT